MCGGKGTVSVFNIKNDSGKFSFSTNSIEAKIVISIKISHPDFACWYLNGTQRYNQEKYFWVLKVKNLWEWPKMSRFNIELWWGNSGEVFWGENYLCGTF